jgi:hypothetical protein
LPFPLAPPVTVIHDALLTPVQAHPAATVTVTLPVPPAAVKLCDVGDALNVHAGAKLNVFEKGLDELPPGPTATTSATYTVPGTGQPTNTVVRSTWIRPSELGAGFPNGTVWNGACAPERKRPSW